MIACARINSSGIGMRMVGNGEKEKEKELDGAELFRFYSCVPTNAPQSIHLRQIPSEPKSAREQKRVFPNGYSHAPSSGLNFIRVGAREGGAYSCCLP